MVAHVASAPTQASMYPYIMLTPLPLTNAVVKKLSNENQHAPGRRHWRVIYGMADSQVHIIVVVKARMVIRPKRR